MPIWNSPAWLLLPLLAGHLVADSVLQPQRLSHAKRQPGWAGFRALAFHGTLHGLTTGLILWSWPVVLAEACSHALIDWGKCREKYGMLADQAAHVACKCLWIYILLLS